MANFSRTDLDFIIQQAIISEADSAAQVGGNFNALPGLIGSPLLPDGLRNVDGTYNNLVDVWRSGSGISPFAASGSKCGRDGGI